MFGRTPTFDISRRGLLAAGLLMAGASRAWAEPGGEPSGFAAYEQRLRARLADAGGGTFQTDFAQALLPQVNRFRGGQRLSAYQWDEGLAACARAHAADMAARNYFAHEAPEGYTHLDRVSLLTRDFCGQTAENLAWRSDVTQASTPAQFEQLWETSPGHRRNLLRETYSRAGYGVVRVGNAYYAAGVYADPAVTLARPMPLRMRAGGELSAALQGSSPMIDKIALTAPFRQPTEMTTPGQAMLAPGVWQLRPLRPTAGRSFDVLSGPLFFVG